ncbi:YajQ family cyclic di-GMP-binding protein [Zhaonella formicivorans]|uniref:YajQ family cyclic di-GMP-binding protein n=1 Tax=Zhaonella formicivorans TaxID=2528593 RepID=UPI0010D4D558|nr:YajQ family cyclic di-GMP-binding protein [Zhaonella formicivorans]
MAKDCSFDVVSEVDLQELDNAVNQTKKEIAQRYDFKGSKSAIELEGTEIKIIADNEYKLKAVIDILQSKMIKRKVSLKALTYGKVEPASGGTVRQALKIQKGIDKEKGKQIVSAVKELKLKVQAQVLEDQVRVTGKNKDDLQAVIQALKTKDFGIDLQFVNFRS